MAKKLKLSSNVSLPINSGNVAHPEFIPKNVPFQDNRKLLEKCAILIEKQIPILMIGETGLVKLQLFVTWLTRQTMDLFV